MTGRRFLVLSFLLCVLCVSVVNPCAAHPIGEKSYHRIIGVRLRADAVVVNYELEVNTATVLSDLLSLGEEIDLSKCHSPRDFYETFTTFHAPVLARNLGAKLDGKSLTFTAVEQRFEVLDKVSLHCRFTFRAPWSPTPDKLHQFRFRELNYEEQTGRIRLSLTSADDITIKNAVVPSAALQDKPLTALAPGEDEELRQARASFVWHPAQKSALPIESIASSPETKTDAPSAFPKTETKDDNTPGSLPRPWDAESWEELLQHRDAALWLLLMVAAFLGAAHALTPGHGKTLVAAYLVGERGTIGHALYLGLVTTLSHTGTVILLAAIVHFACHDRAPPSMQVWLGLGSGLLVAGMGIWLLLARLTGRADHVHLFNGHHHHHGHGHGHGHGHRHGDHYHDEHGHVHALPKQPVGWWRLTLLGIGGGIIPCHDAVALYFSLWSLQLLALALPLLLAFSVGLAAVLVGIGIVVVKTKGAVGRQWGESRLFKALPIVSAAVVAGMGLWLCYHNLPTTH